MMRSTSVALQAPGVLHFDRGWGCGYKRALGGLEGPKGRGSAPAQSSADMRYSC
jgi:hypothetical protein